LNFPGGCSPDPHNKGKGGRKGEYWERKGCGKSGEGRREERGRRKWGGDETGEEGSGEKEEGRKGRREGKIG
jgi:hypothetical protein